MDIELPYPPSVNTYWRKVGNRMVVSKKGREYKRVVSKLVRNLLAQPMPGLVAVEIAVAPPDRKDRDLDNLLKAPLDALKGCLYVDDSQIDDIHIYRVAQVRGGRLYASIRSIDGPEALDTGMEVASLAQEIQRLEMQLQAAREALEAMSHAG